MKTTASVLIVIGLLACSAGADEGPTPPRPPELTREQRNAMARLHEKMAVCLRSERPLVDCHDEMLKGCRDTMGAGCPMMRGPGAMKPPR